MRTSKDDIERQLIEKEYNLMIAEKRAEQKQIERQSAIKELEYTIAMRALKKVEQMLAFPLQTVEMSADGKTTIIHPTTWRFSDISRLLEVASRVSRLSTDLKTDNTTQSVDESELDKQIEIMIGKLIGVKTP